jgi:hypothetical protein
VDGVFKIDVDLVAEGGLGFADGAGGQLQYRGGLDPDSGHAPRFQVLFEVDDHAVAVKVDGVDREAHGEGVDAVGGVDPKALAARETGGVGGHESAKAGPVGPGDHEIGGEVGGAGAVKGEAPGAAWRHCSPGSRSEDFQQLNYGGTHGDEDERGHDEQDQGNDHLDGGLRGLFFGALAALGAQGI